MRKQLRPFYTPQQLARVYDHPYDHTRWPDHVERVAETVRVLDDFAATVGAETVADLSCGDGAVVGQSTHPWRERHLGDYVTTGPIEKTLPGLRPVDMFVCSETIEHVEDPDGLLRAIRGRAKHLLLTTPLGEDHDRNPEHYWGWDADDMRQMLEGAGWTRNAVELFTPTSITFYTFQMWRCS